MNFDEYGGVAIKFVGSGKASKMILNIGKKQIHKEKCNAKKYCPSLWRPRYSTLSITELAPVLIVVQFWGSNNNIQRKTRITSLVTTSRQNHITCNFGLAPKYAYMLQKYYYFAFKNIVGTYTVRLRSTSRLNHNNERVGTKIYYSPNKRIKIY